MKKRLLVAMVAALLAATGALPAGAGSQGTTDVLNQDRRFESRRCGRLCRRSNSQSNAEWSQNYGDRPNASTGLVRLSGWCRGRPSGGIHVVVIRVQSAGPMVGDCDGATSAVPQTSPSMASQATSQLARV